MKTIWYSHLTGDDQIDEFKKYVRNSIGVLKRLHSIVRDKTNSVRTVRTANNTYDTPAWPYKQAYLNGKEEAYQEILSLLKLNNPED